jgi:uncharacterized membrane-anchored protein
LTEKAISLVERRIVPSRLSAQSQEAIALYVRPDPVRAVQRRELALVVASAVSFGLVMAAWVALAAICSSVGAADTAVIRIGNALLTGIGAGLALHLMRYYIALTRIFRGRGRQSESRPVETQQVEHWPWISSDLDVVLQALVVCIVLLLVW